jgi:hypothetical protein
MVLIKMGRADPQLKGRPPTSDRWRTDFPMQGGREPSTETREEACGLLAITGKRLRSRCSILFTSSNGIHTSLADDVPMVRPERALVLSR